MEMEFGIEICALLIMKSGKRESRTEKICQIKKASNAWKGGKLQVLGNIESAHHQTDRKEK